MQVTTIGLDIAKNVFQVHGIDAAEKVTPEPSYMPARPFRPRRARASVTSAAGTIPEANIHRQAGGILPAETKAASRERSEIDCCQLPLHPPGDEGVVRNQSARRAPRRNSPGVLPVQRRKAWRKFAGSLYPTAVAMSSLVMTVSRRYFTAICARSSSTNLRNDVSCCCSWRRKVRVVVSNCSAMAANVGGLAMSCRRLARILPATPVRSERSARSSSHRLTTAA